MNTNLKGLFFNMALISLQNVNIHFGGPKILDDLNLQIEKKQRVCLLGRNGAGKSTLMKLISGQLIADARLTLLFWPPERFS